MNLRTLFATAVLAVAPLELQSQDSGIPIGTRAPAFSIEDLDRKPVDVGQFIGKTPVLIEFWATWCENCRALEPALLAAQKKHGARVKFIGVAVSFNESVERVKLYAQKHGLAHQILYDRKGDATTAYEVPATSYVVVIDRTGKVVYTGLGGDQNLEAALAKVDPAR
ncbi:MAG: TlpA disulfide reductase family protein [Gemmatimonadaceae bacterium]